MHERISRARRLTLLAAGNLVCWLVVAVVAGLLIGDGVDLGVETLIRQGQATVVAAWEQFTEKPSREERTAPANQGPVPTTTPSAEGRPPAAIAWPTTAVRSQATTVPGAAVGASPATPTPGPSASPQPTPRPALTAISSPLLMSDPPISNVLDMDAEMTRSAPGRAVQIRYRETALNREIAAMLRRNPALPYRDVEVDLKPDRVIVTGSVTVLGFHLSTQAVGTVSIQDCLPKMEIQSVSIAGVLTPGFVKDEVRKMIREALAWYPSDYPLCLEQIVLEETRATVYGHRRQVRD